MAKNATKTATRASRFGRKPKEQTEADKLKGTFAQYPHLISLKPKERYVFRSDYFKVDNYVACILGFFHDDAAKDGFAAFWGINRIPSGLPDDVTTVVLEQVSRMGEDWLNEHQKRTEQIERMNAREEAESGTAQTRRRNQKVTSDMTVITDEIIDGAAYLHVQDRLFVKAPNLETLEEAIEKISRLYIDRFGTLHAAPYYGAQRRELSQLWAPNDKKMGKGFHFTSTEFAGSHSLVTHGLNDATGEYVGYMVGDVNSSAILMDTNKYDHHVVIASNVVNEYLDRAHVPDMWGSKLSQACLLANGRAVHLVLDGANLDRLGPRLDSLTARVDMSNGDVNMFEMFGEPQDALAIFPIQMQKLILMAEQTYDASDYDRSLIRGQLEEVATQFYIDRGMWYLNPQANLARLRVVGIKHDQVPRLQEFVVYLRRRQKELQVSKSNVNEELHAVSVLLVTFRNLLNNNSDLFNTFTKPAIDNAHNGARVIYDFSKLMPRGKGIAMAQLVNIIGFATNNLGKGDSLIIHGAELIDSDPKLKEFLSTCFESMFARGGRVVYLYNTIEKMLADQPFNNFDAADYTILGPMRDATVERYKEALNQSLAPDLERLITQRGENLCYLRRDVNNVVFSMDLALGINPARKNKPHLSKTKKKGTR